MFQFQSGAGECVAKMDLRRVILLFYVFVKILHMLRHNARAHVLMFLSTLTPTWSCVEPLIFEVFAFAAHSAATQPSCLCVVIFSQVSPSFCEI